MSTVTNRIAVRPSAPIFEAEVLAAIDAARRGERASHEALKDRVLNALKELSSMSAKLSRLAESLSDDGETLALIAECRRW